MKTRNKAKLSSPARPAPQRRSATLVAAKLKPSRLTKRGPEAVAPTHTPLNMAVVIPELAKYGGAERYLIECVSRWQDLHDITIYASKIDEQLLQEHGIGSRVKLMRLSPYFEGRHSILLNAVLLPKIWEQEISVHDVYHTHLWPTHLIDLHPMVWYPHEPLRILHDLRYEQPLEDVAGIFQRNLHIYPKYNYDRITDVTYEAYLASMDMFDKLGKPDRIVANSRYTAGYLEGVYNTKVRDVVYPGVNVDDFIFQPSDENIFLTIGQLWPHKRIKLIIEAMKHVDNAQLYIVGNGPDKEKLMRTAAGLGLSNRVFFLHGLNNLEVQILFSRALAVVFAPVKEPFGIVALEAMAAGKPLIAANEGGFTEVVDETCAFLCSPQPEELAEKMRHLRDNKDVARRMGDAGRQKVKDYTWEKAAKDLLGIIEKTHHDWVARTAPAAAAGDTGEVTVPRQTTQFGIQYYCWYGNGIGSRHWNDSQHAGGVTDMPKLGYYGSSSRTTIEEHWKLFEEAGINFVVLNLHIDGKGASGYELAAAENIFSVVESRQTAPGHEVKLAIQVCPYECKREQLVETLEVVAKMFARRKSYLHLRGKPVLFFFWTGVQDGNKTWLNAIEDHTPDMFRIASSLRMYSAKDERSKTFGVFDGWSLYSPLELSQSASWERLWRQAYRNYDAGSAGLKVVTVSPGYDDRHLRDANRKGNLYRSIDRQKGATYQRTIDFALSVEQQPDLVLVSTFNEYHENTHIEPSRTHGRLYMDMTREFIQKAKDQWKL